MSTPVGSEKTGYRRGLILGLTMAESMLLLVFCLLLVAGAVISTQRKAADHERRDAIAEMIKLQTKLGQLVSENKDLKDQLAATVAKNGSTGEVEENWKDLVKAREIVIAYERTGISAQKLSSLTEDIKTLIALDNEGLSAHKLELIKEDIKVLESLKTAGITSDDFRELAPLLEVLQQKQLSKTDAGTRKANLAEMIDRSRETPSDATKPHQWPPIINLSEAGGYYFRIGSAQLSEDFKKDLTGSITNRLASILDEYNVDLIEVIGHTDEQPLGGVLSNLDKQLNSVLSGKSNVSLLKPGDNAGLGLARAIAVTQILQSQKKLKKATVLPYSAAQVIVPGDTITVWNSGNVESRRRIEIRVRRRAVEPG